MSSTILQKIRSSVNNFSDAHKKVAKYILANHEDVAFMTSTKLAQNSGISESTVIRFAYGLGYEGYADMQKDLRSLVRGKLTQIERLGLKKPLHADGSLMAQLSQSMRTDMVSIERTILGIPEEDLEKIVDAICNANSVYVIGVRTAYGLAHYFGYALSWIRPHVRLLDSPNNALFDRMSDIAPGDVAIAISVPLYPVHTLEMFKLAHGLGATTIAITDSFASPLLEYSTHHLCAHNEVTTFVDNMAPFLSLLTGLLALVSDRRPEESAARLSNLERFWQDSDVYLQND